MKKVKGIFINVTLLAFVLALSGCPEPPVVPTETGKEKNTKILTTNSPWTLVSAKVDNVDKTSLYAGLTISFTSSGFTTTNGRSIWPASGTWHFTNDEGTTIERNDGLIITVSSISETSLELGFSWNKTTLGGGRTESVSGQHVFTFN